MSIVRVLIQNYTVRTVGKVASQGVGGKQILIGVNPQARTKELSAGILKIRHVVKRVVK